MIVYFDCFSGISGDMILGSLVDAGVSLQRLKKELSRIPVKGYKLQISKVKRSGFAATKVDVKLQGVRGQGSGVRKFKDIEKIVKDSTLSKEIKQKGLKIFKRLFKAEAKVHGGSFQNVHLHELGAVDCIIDIFGTIVGLDLLGIDEVYASPLNLGSGSVKTAHGILPVPAPAVLELLKGVPVYSSDVPVELTTPTGAVLISSLCSKFITIPGMRISNIGIGAGNRDIKGYPNVLRLFIGEDSGLVKKSEGEEIRIIETNIDDMNPQVYEYVMDRLFRAGALDVFLTQIIMKKGRPGIKLTVLCDEKKIDIMTEIILKETTSIGLRFYSVQRRTLQRELKTLNSKFGKVRVKLSHMDDIEKSSPEYEDCKKIAKKYNIPLLDVMKILGFEGSRVQGFK